MRRHAALLCAAVATHAFAPPTHNHFLQKQQQPTRVAPLALGGKEGEGLGDVLRKYGVVALVFHFSVWLTTLSASVAALSVYDTSTLLEALPEPLRGQIPISSGAATLPVALALCEVVGPARLALTVAATPAVASTLRSNARFVELEDSVNERLLELLPGGGSD
ncbi:unnamed protein product [Pelagomonas calceolata]|uniref:DUF1279 domain-containing protein n=1 Tax=Pelagomonas calceolata TaxID=35677 RepID=A0A7S4ECS3_9STRA|nr:unnamed protein product [Pelagomonas calceolata]|mmetsp:Transcript_19880/g.61316  ORF Transcript_19880/g.61316 Transcript_19880/m.61316 type:complete len:164 (+) Transcript_19880:175-666(+)